MVAVVVNVILYMCMHRSAQAYVCTVYVHMWTHMDTMLLTVARCARLDLCSGSFSLTVVSASQSRYKLSDKKRALDVDEDTYDDRSVCMYRWPYVRT